MRGPLKIDAQARQVGERLLLAAEQENPTAALAAASEYKALGLRVRVIAPDFDFAPEAPEFVAARPPLSHVFGRPFSARYAGTCVVCSQPVQQGAPAVYCRESRSLAHARCAAGGGG